MPRVAERMQAVLESGRFILGPEVESFEREFADYLGARHGIGVANGTDALTIAIRALGVEPGDEVIVPAISFYATAEAVVNAGARPVFADVEEHTWCVTAATIEPILSERTTAIVPVHLFGNPAPMTEILEIARNRNRPIRVLEDAAQAAGATYGNGHAGAIGDAAAFSFYPSKNLGAFGDGGAITTNDDEVAARCRELRFHGSKDKKIHTEVGYNSRLDELQAAALRVLLPELDDWTELRRRVAADYEELGLGEFVELPRETPGARSAYHLYIVSTPEREALQERLRAEGIGTRVYYTPPLHRQPGLERFAPERRLTGADRFSDECLALPMGPALPREDVERVVAAAASR
jgi:dTDP-3-amino-3,4,6-trideoxy-alpha-D-glucose transaminase